jgi:polar amino acid transport system ATP-binding protein
MTQMLIIRNLSKRWGNGDPALDSINFSAAPGSITAIIGPSGAGKSVLLRTIAGLESYEAGEIVNPFGQPGMVFQDPSLWPHLSLLDNVSLPLQVLRGVSKAEANRRAMEMLAAWKLDHRAQAHPAELSGGQQQRGALARAYIMEPKILCLDEITSALDPETANEIFNFLENWKREMIILLATHHLGYARDRANQILFIDGGKIVEQGTGSIVITQPLQPRTQAFVSASQIG